MYSKDQFLQHFILLLKPATFYHSLPFIWRPDENLMKSSFPSPLKRSLYKFQCNLHVFFTISIIVQAVITNPQDPSTKSVCFFTVALLSFTSAVVKEYSTNYSDTTLLINRYIYSSRIYSGWSVMDRYERNRKRVVELLNPGTFLFPIMYTLGVTIKSPCWPSNFGSWMLTECGNPWSRSPTTEFFIKSVIVATNFWIWSFGMHAAVVVGSGVVMVGAMFFRHQTILYGKLMKVFKSTGKVQYNKITLLYRQIQILSGHHNSIHQRLIVTTMINATVFTQSICIYCLVSLENLPWMNKLFFTMMGFDCFCTIVMLCGALADVYDVSSKLLNYLCRRHRRNPWLYRFHKSCRPIKMHFGITNFMEKLTPLNLQQFSFLQTANMLLVNE